LRLSLVNPAHAHGWCVAHTTTVIECPYVMTRLVAKVEQAAGTEVSPVRIADVA
jgi:hypothetical protein